MEESSGAHCLAFSPVPTMPPARILQPWLVERSTPFYDGACRGHTNRVLAPDCLLHLVFSQVYFDGCESVRALFDYHDFSRWFLSVKGEIVRKGWTICFPLIQFTVMLIVAMVSFVIICFTNEPFDIVMNSLAFIFIIEIGGYFNAPLVKQMGATQIEGIDESHGYTINYLYPDYLLSNAINDDGTYTDTGWHLVDDEHKAGLLCDYKVRHNPELYPHPSRALLGKDLVCVSTACFRDWCPALSLPRVRFRVDFYDGRQHRALREAWTSESQ